LPLILWIGGAADPEAFRSPLGPDRGRPKGGSGERDK
jgi:hypothetical protein